MIDQMINVFLVASETIVHTDYFTTVIQQPFTKMGAEKTGTAGDKNCFAHISFQLFRFTKVILGPPISSSSPVLSQLPYPEHDHPLAPFYKTRQGTLQIGGSGLYTRGGHSPFA